MTCEIEPFLHFILLVYLFYLWLLLRLFDHCKIVVFKLIAVHYGCQLELFVLSFLQVLWQVLKIYTWSVRLDFVREGAVVEAIESFLHLRLSWWLFLRFFLL